MSHRYRSHSGTRVPRLHNRRETRGCHARLSTSNLYGTGGLRQDPGRAAQSLAGARTYGNGNSQMRVLLSTYTAGACL